jgi:glycosyltransferase involved in cell wall biosynthesis
MQGRKFLGRVRRLAGRLQRIKVVFPGYVTGLRKQAFFHLANLYLFPSRHESYGLTLMEAMQAGLPAVCLDHGGARELMGSGFAEIVQGEPVAGLHRAVQAMLADPVRLRELGVHARQFALARPFSVTARALADRILRCRG